MKIKETKRDNKGRFLSNHGEAHPRWKGNGVGYEGLHMWLVKELGKATYCSNNKSHVGKRFEWANISGKYLRDTSDYCSLCPSCHRKLDFTDEQRRKISEAKKGKTYAAKRVKQFDLMGNFIKEFESRSEARRQTGTSVSGISNVLSGLAKTAGGYIWSE